jgi:hypothetical protein
MLLIALLARGIFWLSVVIIVGSAASYFWGTYNIVMVFFSIVFFPLTYFIYPWISGLQGVFLIGMLAYILSTSLGMRAVD